MHCNAIRHIWRWLDRLIEHGDGTKLNPERRVSILTPNPAFTNTDVTGFLGLDGRRWRPRDLRLRMVRGQYVGHECDDRHFE